MTDPLKARSLIQVGHAMNMIAELPRYVDDQTLPVGLQAAAIDAFFLHLRALMDFLLKDDERGIQWRDYTTNFHLDNSLRARLLSDFAFASQHVVHLNKAERVPSAISPPARYMSATDLAGSANDAFAAMLALLEHLRRTGSPYATELGRLLAEAQSRRP